MGATLGSQTLAYFAQAASTAATVYSATRGPGKPPPPPGVPNQSAAENASMQQADELRRRRGLLSTIYGGGQPQQPAVGKTTLG